ncbi:hypothetical protein [Umezawaea sp.]|uniref:hypothetical protein n=1 Tax=Umezawaea sp. TaxID=1955258 RepID=UPI002ED58536
MSATARSADAQAAGPAADAAVEPAGAVVAVDGPGDRAETEAGALDGVPPPWLVQALSRAAETARVISPVVLTTGLP